VSDRTPLDPAEPDQLAQLLALDGLWKAHAKALTFLDSVPNAHPRTDNLVAFQFTTATVTDPLDPSVAESAAAQLGSVGFLQLPFSVTNKFDAINGPAICAANGVTNATQCFLDLALGGCDPLGVGCDLTVAPTSN